MQGHLFAIVDIETTGGSASQGGITEIAILLHNGQEVTDRFATLIDPKTPIPRYITVLTGISDQMVAGAPAFHEVAPHLYDLLKDRIFVAHNVNFDHSFLHHHFKLSDIHFQPKKLCTVRLARKLMPGLTSYSLGNLCRSLGIHIEGRHRATGDALATAQLFNLLLQKDADGKVLKEMTKGRNPHAYLPMHVPVEMIDQLPYCPGVYYFKDRMGKVVYVGKAVNLKYRVKSHFTNNATGNRRQEMIRNIFSIEYKTCSTELMAIVLESIEIKRLWPKFNRSQKRYEATYGLYPMEDRGGRLRLVIEKRKKHLPALHIFSNLTDGHHLVAKFAAKCNVQLDWVFGQNKKDETLPNDFNQRMQAIIQEIKQYLPDFAFIEPGEDVTGKQNFAIYKVEKGTFTGMGCTYHEPKSWQEICNLVEPYPENEFIRNTLLNVITQKEGIMIYPGNC